MRTTNHIPKTNIGRKLASNSGASILFALFLFLVCAAIGSVVLTAGTAAAGRLSKTAEMDQRFYAVQSAAQLFKDQLDGQSVGIVRTETTVDTEVTSSYKDEYGVGHSSTETTSDDSPSYTMTWTNGTSITDGNTVKILTNNVALNALCGGETDAAKAWSKNSANSTASSYSETLQLQLTTNSEGSASDVDPSDIPAVTVTCSTASDGSLTFVFTADNYSVRLKMLAVVSDGPSSIRTSQTSSTPPEGTGTQTDPVVVTTYITTVESKTSTIKWTFGSLDVMGK